MIITQGRIKETEIAGVLKNFGYAYNKVEKAFIKGGQ